MPEKPKTTYVEVSDFDARDFQGNPRSTENDPFNNPEFARGKVQGMVGEFALKRLNEGDRVYGVVTKVDAQGNKAVDRVINLDPADIGTEIMEPHPNLGEVKPAHYQEPAFTEVNPVRPGQSVYDFRLPSEQQAGPREDLVAKQKRLGIEVDEPRQVSVRPSISRRSTPRATPPRPSKSETSDDDYYAGAHYLR